MGLFDFLKPKINETENIEMIFEKAANDTSYRPLFYRALIQSELFILTTDKYEFPKGKFISDKDTKLQVRTFENGLVPVFTSTDRIFDNNIVKGQVNYAAMKASVIFEMFKDKATFILNPYSKVSKELLPEEIRQLRTNGFFSPDEISTIEAGETISLGIPAKYPVNVAESLKRYCGTKKQIRGAYLAVITVDSAGKSPHLLLGIDANKTNTQEIFSEIGEVVRPYLGEGEIIDMLDLSDKTNTTKYLKTNQFKIY